ncbi:MAG: DUF1801 domain-containing protein [Hyphomicrobiaceae bacterium]
MAKNKNKTQPTDIDPQDFLSAVEHPRRREDGFALYELFNRVTQLPAKMWGESIVGYGRYCYKYNSGREGEAMLTGFSPRQRALSVYILPGYRDLSEILERLGKHKTGRSCLYINNLSDIDLAVLEELILVGLKYMYENYETWEE